MKDSQKQLRELYSYEHSILLLLVVSLQILLLLLLFSLLLFFKKELLRGVGNPGPPRSQSVKCKAFPKELFFVRVMRHQPCGLRGLIFTQALSHLDPTAMSGAMSRVGQCIGMLCSIYF